ncbi:MAG: nicotinate (nicotinamide) nucleotide adenylyltransferase [Chloroflexi bacterium]|nr:nicotinate (nicotinamide) nucleotide adenylyltransferase [Chloroflexota bacterium]
MKLGLLGGTFDPPHFGHLRMAQAALDQLHLDRVLFAPAGVQPLRQAERHTPPEQRARMVELAIADQPCFTVSRLDLDRPGPHYTVDLLALVHQQHPDAAVWFIMGEDSLSDLPRWREPARLITLARLAVLRRPGYEPDWPTFDAALPNLRAHLDWLDHAEIDISARVIRQRVNDGLPIDHLVPAAVAVYIAEHHLYRT